MMCLFHTGGWAGFLVPVPYAEDLGPVYVVPNAEEGSGEIVPTLARQRATGQVRFFSRQSLDGHHRLGLQYFLYQPHPLSFIWSADFAHARWKNSTR